MNTVEKINIILKEANISKVNLAKYLGVSRQMVYNYLELKQGLQSAGRNFKTYPNYQMINHKHYFLY